MRTTQNKSRITCDSAPAPMPLLPSPPRQPLLRDARSSAASTCATKSQRALSRFVVLSRRDDKQACAWFVVILGNCGASEARREMYIALGVMMRVMAMMLAMGHGRDRLMKGETSDDIHAEHDLYNLTSPAQDLRHTEARPMAATPARHQPTKKHHA